MDCSGVDIATAGCAMVKDKLFPTQAGASAKLCRPRDGSGFCFSAVRFTSSHSNGIIQPRPGFQWWRDPCREMFIRVVEPCFDEQEKAKKLGTEVTFHRRMHGYGNIDHSQVLASGNSGPKANTGILRHVCKPPGV